MPPRRCGRCIPERPSGEGEPVRGRTAPSWAFTRGRQCTHHSEPDRDLIL
jgi:hypothetical protein